MAKCEECFSFRSCQAWCVVIDKLLQTNRAREELQKDDAESCPSFKNKADVQEVKHGEWKQTQEPLGVRDVTCAECSVCGESWIIDEDISFEEHTEYWNYCVNCGAKMDKRSEGK